ALGGEANLIGGILHLTLSVKGRKSAAALDQIGTLPYPVALKLTASERLNDRDLGRLTGAANLRRLEQEGATDPADAGMQPVAAKRKRFSGCGIYRLNYNGNVTRNLPKGGGSLVHTVFHHGSGGMTRKADVHTGCAAMRDSVRISRRGFVKAGILGTTGLSLA